MGTIQNMIGSEVLHTERTTPESLELQALFRQMADAGCTHVVMEVSSHALSLHRVGCVTFDVGLFTNLTQDHLDFHHTMEEYGRAKALLFRQSRVGLVNTDDPWAPASDGGRRLPHHTYAARRDADLQALDIDLEPTAWPSRPAGRAAKHPAAWASRSLLGLQRSGRPGHRSGPGHPAAAGGGVSGHGSGRQGPR